MTNQYENHEPRFVTVACAQCGKEFQKSASVVNFDKRRGKKDHFCTRECFRAFFWQRSGFQFKKNKKG